MDTNEMRKAYLLAANAIMRAAGVSAAAVRARADRLAHELADGEEVRPTEHLAAVREIEGLVCGAYRDAEHRRAGARELAALRITEREIKRAAAAPAARTTPETPRRYVQPTPPPAAPPSPPKVAPAAPKAAPASSVVAALNAALRAPVAAPAAPELDENARKRLALNAALCAGPRFAGVA